MVYRVACEETYHYAVNQGLVDWTIPADHAVRRFAERALTEAGHWEATLEGRIQMSPAYRAYWDARQALPLTVLDLSEEVVR